MSTSCHAKRGKVRVLADCVIKRCQPKCGSMSLMARIVVVSLVVSIIMLWHPAAEAGSSNYEPTYPPHFMRTSAHAKAYYIEFRARDEVGGYGHSYVTLGTVDETGRGQETVVAGFMPKASKDDHWSQLGLPVTGTIGVVRSDLVRRPVVRFRVAITKATYYHAVNRIYRLRTSWKTYGLLGPNCNSFVGDVADSIGLRTPIMTAQYPVHYVSELRALNSR